MRIVKSSSSLSDKAIEGEIVFHRVKVRTKTTNVAEVVAKKVW